MEASLKPKTQFFDSRTASIPQHLDSDNCYLKQSATNAPYLDVTLYHMTSCTHLKLRELKKNNNNKKGKNNVVKLSEF